MLEQLFFKILGLSQVRLYQMGSQKQYIWIDLGEVNEMDYISAYSHSAYA